MQRLPIISEGAPQVSEMTVKTQPMTTDLLQGSRWKRRAKGAVVIGGHCGGLGLVRSLGRHRIPVWVLSGASPLPAASRYARHSMPWPESPETEQRDFLLTLADRRGLDGWVLFPATDGSAALVARHHAVLGEHFVLTSPPWESLRWAYDKRLTYMLAAQLNIDYPWTRYPRNIEDLAGWDCTYPLILKPTVKEGDNAFLSAKAWRVDHRQDLLARYAEACTLVPPDTIMVQELVPGSGTAQISYGALCQDGRPLATIIAKRRRQYPVDFGISSTMLETVDLPAVEEPARKLLKAMNYTGLAEIEFKYDARDDRYKVLDINARQWNWHSLGRKAGVDFPYLFWRLLEGKSVSETRARIGVRWVHMVRDVLAAGTEIRGGTLSLRGYYQSLRGAKEWAVFALDDPKPAMEELAIHYGARMIRPVWHRPR